VLQTPEQARIQEEQLRRDNIAALTGCFLLSRTRESLALDLATAFYTAVDLDREVILLKRHRDRDVRGQDAFRLNVLEKYNANPKIPTSLKQWNQRRRTNAGKNFKLRYHGTTL
jgi:hypothetical protein